MILNVDLASELPIYQQLRDQVVEAIADGTLTEAVRCRPPGRSPRISGSTSTP